MNMRQQVKTREEIKNWIAQWIAKDLQLPVEEIQIEKSLLDYSLSSITATMLVGDLEDWLGLTLEPTLVWDYPSIDALVDHLCNKQAETSSANPDASQTVPAIATDVAASGDHAQQLLANLDGLSDQQVHELLEKLMAESQVPVNS